MHSELGGEDEAGLGDAGRSEFPADTFEHNAVKRFCAGLHGLGLIKLFAEASTNGTNQCSAGIEATAVYGQKCRQMFAITARKIGLQRIQISLDESASGFLLFPLVIAIGRVGSG